MTYERNILYDSIKTANYCFKTGVTAYNKESTFKHDMAPSKAEAHIYKRTSQYPKSTKYGRQNPISAQWNSDEQLVLWLAAWADTDHRSHADRGLDEQPTIHEGVTARALEKRGIVSDRCELNRQIKADNALLWELKAQVKKPIQAVQNIIPATAEAMESLRQDRILLQP